MPAILLKADMLNGEARLVIEIVDTAATHIRLYKGKHGSLQPLPGLTEIRDKKIVILTDSRVEPGKIKEYVYAVRNEKEGLAASGLSNELPATVNAYPDQVDYFRAFASGQHIVLYWDDVAKRNSRFVRYSLARHYGPENSRSPLVLLGENLTECNFTDLQAQAGTMYTYILMLTDREGVISEKTYTITTSPGTR